MKAQQPFFYKDGPVKYVRRIKAAYTLFSALFIVAFMVLLVFAFNGSDVGKPVFFSVAAVLLIIILLITTVVMLLKKKKY